MLLGLKLGCSLLFIAGGIAAFQPDPRERKLQALTRQYEDLMRADDRQIRDLMSRNHILCEVRDAARKQQKP